MSTRLDWQRDGRDWPNREHSRFVNAGGLRWHVQIAGRGPALLLLHGTGAASHSWRDLLPLLAADFQVVVPDLPGHGFSGPPPTRSGYSIPGMARLVSALLTELHVAPHLVAGHSAGAAVLARMSLEGMIRPHRLVSLNGALIPLPGMSVPLFLLAGRLLAATPLPQLFARRVSDLRNVRRLMQRTGSNIDERGIALYHRIVSNSAHVRDVLKLMAHWDLRELARDLPRLTTPLVLVATGNDLTMPPREAARVQQRVPNARLVEIAGLGHLAHEEAPLRFGELLSALANEPAVISKDMLGQDATVQATPMSAQPSWGG